MKDIETTQRADVSDVLASYGTNHFEENKGGHELFRAVTHWADADAERERKTKEDAFGAKPTYAAEQFSDILFFFEFTKFKRK